MSKAAVSRRSRPVVIAARAALVLLVAAAPRDAGAQAAAPPAAARPLVLRNVHVVPMDREQVLRDRTVVVRDGRIAAISGADVAIPPNALLVDGRGRYLAPGLIDAHIHILGGTGAEGDGAWQQMALLVANGITTARSLGGGPTAPQVRDAVRSGSALGPRLYLAGPSLNHRSVTTPEAARAAVREQAAAGFDFLKTHGASSDVYDAIVETARAEGIRLSGHVTPDYGLARALAAGQQIEHLDGYLAATMPADAPVEAPPGQLFFGPELDHMSEAAMPGLAARTVAADVWNSPTLALFELVADPQPVEHYQAWPEMRYVPAAAREAWSKQVAQMAAQPATAERRARYIELRRAMTRALRDAGAPLLAGSDSPQLFYAPGFSLHRELGALQRAGLTPFEVLSAATADAARYLEGDDAAYGTVAPGKVADLVLLEANPLEDIGNASRIAGVVLDGRWLDRAALDRALEDVARAAATAPRP